MLSIFSQENNVGNSYACIINNGIYKCITQLSSVNIFVSLRSYIACTCSLCKLDFLRRKNCLKVAPIHIQKKMLTLSEGQKFNVMCHWKKVSAQTSVEPVQKFPSNGAVWMLLLSAMRSIRSTATSVRNDHL